MRNQSTWKPLDFSDEKKRRRVRGFRLTLSYEYESQSTNETEEDWRNRVSDELAEIYNNEKIEFMAYIFHDEDLDEKGLPAGLHVHVDVKFENPRRISSVSELFAVSREENISHIKSYVDSARYLIHVSEKALNAGKHIYDIDEVVCFNCDIKEMMMREGKMKQKKKKLEAYTADIGKRIRDGEITVVDAERLIVEDYGEVEWRRVRHTFEVDEEEYLVQLGKKAMIEGINRKIVYASGAGGVGKSSTMRLVSQRFMDSRGIHKVSVGGRDLTFDFAGTYNGEKVTIADDLDSGYFRYRDFFGMFDPYEYAPSKSRNKDKHWLAEKCLITNSKPLGEWVFDLIYYSHKGMQRGVKEIALSMDAIPIIWQAIRRFNFWLEFNESEIIVRVPTNNKIIGDGKGGTVEVAREVESGSQPATGETLNYYYFEDYATISFNNLFDEQEEIADKIAKIIEGDKKVAGVKFNK